MSCVDVNHIFFKSEHFVSRYELLVNQTYVGIFMVYETNFCTIVVALNSDSWCKSTNNVTSIALITRVK